MVQHYRGRKGLAFGFGTVATVLVMASVAFACTNFKGEVIAYSSSFPGSTTVAHGDGMANNMFFCNNDGNPGGQFVKMQGSSTGAGEIFTVQGNGFVCHNAVSFLMQDTDYHMFASDGFWDDTISFRDTRQSDCMGPGVNYTGHTVTEIGGPYTIGAINGAFGPFQSTTPWKAPVGPAVICFDVPTKQTLDAAPEMNMTFV